jgi:hypothetical protein
MAEKKAVWITVRRTSTHEFKLKLTKEEYLELKDKIENENDKGGADVIDMCHGDPESEPDDWDDEFEVESDWDGGD